MSNLIDVINYIIAKYYSKFEEPISRTKLMKLVFLINQELKKNGLKELTKFYKYLFGPFSKEVLDALDELVKLGAINEHILFIDLDKIMYGYKPSEQGILRALKFEKNENNVKITEIINKIIEKFGARSLNELLEYVYGINIVRKTKFGKEIQ